MKNICLICSKNILEEQWCKCIRCNIQLHDLCEKKYRGIKEYCEYWYNYYNVKKLKYYLYFLFN